MNSPYLLVCQWCGYIKDDLCRERKPACCAPDGDGHLFIRRSVDWVNNSQKVGRFRKFKKVVEQNVLARWQYADNPESSERLMSLDFREWRKVGAE